MSTRVPSSTGVTSHVIVIVPAKEGSSERKSTACTTRRPRDDVDEPRVDDV